MSTVVKNILGGGGLLDWITNPLDVLAAESAKIAANPSAYTVLLNMTVKAAVNGETLEYEIIDLARYDLADGSRKAGIVLMPKKLLWDTHNMNSSNTNTGGWGSSAMRTYINGLSRPSQAVQVKVPYAADTTATVSYSNDYLFIPSYGELFGKYSSGNRSVEGDLFAGATNSNDWRIRVGSNYSGYYWLRSVSGSYYFWSVDYSGRYDDARGAGNSYGVLPCFCI